MNHHCPTGLHPQPNARCYNAHSCRCDGCRHSATARRWKPTSLPAGPYRDLVRTLHAAGWTFEEIGAEAGLTGVTASALARGRHRTVHAFTAAALDALRDRTVLPVPIGRNAARREDEAWLRSGGCSDEEIAARFGVSVNALERMRHRDAARLREAS